MKKAITIAAVSLGIVAVGAPAANAGDGNGGRSAVAKECAKLKKADRAAFKATFGPKHAMRHCIKGQPETPPGSGVAAERSGGQSAAPTTGPPDRAAPGRPEHASPATAVEYGKPEK